jgi:enoyl-CoA hydratase/carnithine racemase
LEIWLRFLPLELCFGYNEGVVIEYRKEGRTAVIVINRPQVRNALDVRALEEMRDVLVDFETDPGFHSGIITGAGSDAFCSGIDIRAMLSPQTATEESRTFPDTLMRGLEVSKPLIAAINGAALGGGLEIVLACDLRIASSNSVFGFPEVTLGLIPGWGGSQRLLRQVTWCQAAQLLLTGKSIDASEALRMGLINRVAPLPDLLPGALEWAESINRAAPLAVQAAKEAMSRGMQLPLDEGLDLEDALLTWLKTTRDFSEGLQAFRQKRPPDFQGR